MNFYSIRHLTNFRYNRSVSESVMETRMQPRSDNNQRCLNFSLSVSPRCRVFSYRDHLGNNVQHFDIPGDHVELVIIAEAVVEQQPLDEIPLALMPSAWDQLDAIVERNDFWEMLLPSEFAKPTSALLNLARELKVCRRGDPLSLLRELNTALFDYFKYTRHSTQVNSPIDQAIESRRGVCQDFAHTMIALVRHLGIPCRYVSGYLHQGPRGQNNIGEGGERSTEHQQRSAPDATHAWLEAFLPELGWVGFDPTNDELAHARYIRTALGRDYADVPPTRGVYRGETKSELYVAVRVSASTEPPPLDKDLPIPPDWSILVERCLEPPQPASPLLALQQMQQQQQLDGGHSQKRGMVSRVIQPPRAGL